MSFCTASKALNPPEQSSAAINPAASLACRLTVFAYGLICYAIFFGTFVYAFGFVGNFLVPRSIDAVPTSPLWLALAVNLGLLGVFAVQHSVMARPWFKARWTRIVPEPAERSTYVLFSSIALIALFVFWQPMGGVVWHFESPIIRAICHTLFAAGWLLVLVATFAINHFDLFGLRQVWLYFRNRPYTHLPFKTPALYRVVRHPLYLGWFIGFWATPTMTVAHLFFAVVTSVYILMAIRWEENDLVEIFGEKYTDYRDSVPGLVPRIFPNKSEHSR